MKKHLALLILLSTLLTSETVSELAKNKLKVVKINHNGISYVGLDIDNAKIFFARNQLYKAMYQPATNCVYSNLMLRVENQAGENFRVESELYEQKRKTHKYRLGLLGTLAVLALKLFVFN